MLAPCKVSVPVPDLARPMPEPLIMPEAVRLLLALTFHVWLAPRVMGMAKVRLTVEVDMSMPPEPSVSGPAPVTLMAAAAPAT